jgi:hypothetical protein
MNNNGIGPSGTSWYIYRAKDKFVIAGLRRVLDVAENNVRDDSELRTLGRLRRDLDRREQAESPE